MHSWVKSLRDVEQLDCCGLCSTFCLMRCRTVIRHKSSDAMLRVCRKFQLASLLSTICDRNFVCNNAFKLSTRSPRSNRRIIFCKTKHWTRSQYWQRLSWLYKVLKRLFKAGRSPFLARKKRLIFVAFSFLWTTRARLYIACRVCFHIKHNLHCGDWPVFAALLLLMVFSSPVRDTPMSSVNTKQLNVWARSDE